MVRIVAASSLHHAIETINTENYTAIKEKVYSIPGLSLNIHAKTPEKVVQNLIEKDFKDEKDLIVWHDVINKTICNHESNFSRALSVPTLIEVLKSYQNRIRALVYCQRDQTPDILTELQKTNILVLSIEKDLISLRKQKDSDNLQNLKALHQSPVLELKHMHTVLRYEDDLSQVIARSRPKRPSKRARKAIKNTLSAANQYTTPASRVVAVSGLNWPVDVQKELPP